jgi:hypothetical protein
MANLGDGFYPNLVQIASELGMKPEDILNIMSSESGIDPAAHNPGGGASGLIQFMPSTLKDLKFNGTPEDLRNMSGEQQLPLVKQYLQGVSRMFGGPLTSPALVYIGTFFPVGLTLSGVRSGDPSTAIVEANPETFTENGKTYSKKYGKSHIPASIESAAYKSNPLFHGSTPGAITYGDMLNQVIKNTSKQSYIKAVKDMQAATGHAATPQKKTNVPVKAPMQSDNDNNLETNPIDTLNQVADELKNMEPLAASTKKLYFKHLPTNNILIKVNSYDYESELEFARILCSALDEELLSDSFTHSNGVDVEVECKISGPSDLCFDTTKQLTDSIADAFSDATIKIGSIPVTTRLVMNKKSSYEQISWKTADINYRKFLLKFV